MAALTEAPLRRGEAVALAAVALALVVLDLRYFAVGSYRAPIYDAELYHQLSQYLLILLSDTVPGLAGWIKAMAPSIPVDHAADLNRQVVVHFLAGKGLGYPAFLAAAQLVLGEGFERIRQAQAVLHGASALLVFAIGRTLGGRVVGWLALGLFAAYLPFTYMASQVVAEALCATLILLSVYLALRLLDNGPVWLAPVLGGVLIWLGVSRPVYFSLSLLMLGLVALAWVWGRRGRGVGTTVVAVALLLAGYMVPYLGWQAEVTRAEGSRSFIWSPSGVRGIGPSLMESYDVRHNGWVAPAAFLGHKGRTLKPVPVAESLAGHPLESALLRVEKFYRLWKAPATIYTNPFIVGHRLTGGLHLLLLVGAVLGIGVAVRSIPALLVFLPVLFTAAVYTGYFSEERRFAFPVMGLMAVFCGVALYWLWKALSRAGYRAYGRRPERGTVVACAVFAVTGALLWGGGFVLQPWLAPAVGHGVLLAVFAVVGSGLAWRLAGKLPTHRIWAMGLLWGALLLPVTVHLARYHDWHGWQVSLDRPGKVVAQRFELPDGIRWDQVLAATLQIDVLDTDGRVDDLSVRLNGRELTVPIGVDRMPTMLRFAAEQLYPLRRDTDWRSVAVVPGMRSWLSYSINPRWLDGERTVTVRLEGKGGRAPTHVYGDLPVGAADTAPGPRPWLSPRLYQRFGGKIGGRMGDWGRNSLWRYQTEGDMRLYGGTPLAGRATSAFTPDADSGAGRTDDLSDRPFIQSGGYRIRLQLITRDGTEWVL